MKKLYIFKIIVIALLFINSYTVVNAQIKNQKLDVPTRINVDGELNEWNDKLPNFNTSTDIYYGISNDEKNIYLAVRVIDPIAIQKIISNGLSFSLFNSKKDEKIVITFPLMHSKGGSIINNLKKKSDVANQMDSLSKEMNKQLVEKSKEIKVKGVSDMDTLISIYNESKIKAALHFTNRRILNYELSLPILYIQDKINNVAEINYNIQLNGNSGNKTELSPDGRYVVMSGGNGPSVELRATPQTLELITINTPTYFNGKYTFIKKTN